MLALPSLGGVRTRLPVACASPLVARLALAIAGDDPLDYRVGHAPEIRTLQKLLQARLDKATKGLRWMRCHVTVRARDGEGLAVWLHPDEENFVGHAWTLDRRWKDLERTAPGLAPTALNALDLGQRAGLAVYLPCEAIHKAEYTWWGCEPDETMVLEELAANAPKGREIAAENSGIPTRAGIDAALPRFVQAPKARPRHLLETYARRRDTAGELGRATLELLDLVRADRRASSASDADFFVEDDNRCIALAYAAALRWNDDDPMLRALDDFANDRGQGSGWECAYGHYVADDPDELEPILVLVERRLAIARATEKLLDLIGHREGR